MTPPAHALLDRVLAELGAEHPVDFRHPDVTPVPLASRLATADLAAASVSAAALAAHPAGCDLDGDRIAVSYRSDRHLSVDGSRPDVWSPLSGFWRATDGWIRTHANYPHHAARLRSGLRLGDDATGATLADAVARSSAADAVAAIASAGGLAVAVQLERPAQDAALRATPLLDMRPLGAAPPRLSRRSSRSAPLAGVRVLDLTRVIAGPVCTRTLALLGADVLRIDPPRLAEPAWQHLDTGHGKRSARLDARSSRMQDLLAGADVVVLGYRPAALERLGLTPESLAERHPGLVIAQLSAWGIDHPERAGFDSLVQAESGIAMIESPDGDRPGALPAQALDHSAGYLLAAGITALVGRRQTLGGSWLVRTSLRRIAAELLGMPRRPEPAYGEDPDPDPHLQRFEVDGTAVVTARPVIPGLSFSAPHAWGVDQPTWSEGAVD